MFAVIIQTTGKSASDNAQTLVAYHAGKAFTFHRAQAGNRGSAGAWSAGEGNRSANVKGEAVSIPLTAGDLEALDLFEATKSQPKVEVPSRIFQKADRKVRDYSAVTQKTLGDILSDIDQSLHADPSGAGLAIYSGNRPAKPQTQRVLVSAPAVQVTQPVQPVAPAIVPPVQAVPQPAPQPVVQPAVAVSASNISAPAQWASLVVPSPERTKGYLVRQNLYGAGVSEISVFDASRAEQKFVSIIGHAGTGKTTSAEHYASLRGLPFVAIECDIQLDETQTEGTYIPTGNGNELAWSYSALATAIRQPSVVLLNELSRLAPKNASLFLSLLAERRLTIGQRQGEVIEVHPDCLIIADMNPQGYSGVSKQDQALLNRVNVPLEYEYDLAIDRIWCKSESFLTEVVDKWRKNAGQDPTATPFSHRTTKDFCWQVEKFGLRFAVVSLLKRFTATEQDALKLLIQKSAIEIASEFGVSDDNIHITL